MHLIRSAFIIGVLLVATDCVAQTQSADEVLVENRLAKLTRADYETDLLRIPSESRVEFAASPKRLTTMLNTLLIEKTLAREARDAGLDRDPEIARRLALEIDRFLAQTMIAKIEKDAASEFDAKQGELLVTARETYLMNKAKYRQPEQISASHILFDPMKLGNNAALALAKETRAKLAAGANFATLAAELSDDPTAKTNGGELGWFGPNTMDPAFSKAAFALEKPGDLSEPVRSAFGWHIIRLDGRRPPQDMTWEQARKLIMADLKQRFINEARERKLNAIRNDPNMKINQPAIDALVVKLPNAPRPQGNSPAEAK
jgi:peptidyl-prolyl cis-trans isomerase C